MSRRRVALFLSMIGLVTSTGVVAAPASSDEIATGRVLFETCRGCHAIDGYRNAYPGYPVPRIVGQNAAYIVDALEAYRDGARAHPTMQAQASSLSDAEITAIARYLEQQKRRP